MPSIVHSFTISGIDGVPVEIETSTQYGKPQLMIIGLGDQAVREASERIQSAIEVSGLSVPKMKIVINLAPGDLRKQGSHFELGMAIGLLKQTNQLIGSGLPHFALFGELSLDGRIRGCAGILPMVLAARDNGLNLIIVPQENLMEATVVNDVHVFGFSDLISVVAFLDGKAAGVVPAQMNKKMNGLDLCELLDFCDIRGQMNAVQAAVVAAAGGHNLLFTGAPGCGKTMIAQRIPYILPTLTQEEATEVTKIHSIAGLLSKENTWLTERPFRAPHHNISLNALIGGGASAMPGEVSLAHHGVLFLDELAEHSRRSLDAMRQPLEDGYVTISRVKARHRFPAQFMLVGAMNPCPCGYHGSTRCRCSSTEVDKYRKRLSGPFLDRIDIHLHLTAVPIRDLSCSQPATSSATLQERVKRARDIQTERFKTIPGLHTNTRMSPIHIQSFCTLEHDSLILLQNTCEENGSSARNYNRILRLSRTLADLDESLHIRRQDIEKAMSFQPLMAFED